MQINGVDARTAFGVILQFYNLARSADVRGVRACDVWLTEQDGVECVEVCYRSSKNDQMHAGMVQLYVIYNRNIVKLYVFYCTDTHQHGSFII